MSHCDSLQSGPTPAPPSLASLCVPGTQVSPGCVVRDPRVAPLCSEVAHGGHCPCVVSGLRISGPLLPSGTVSRSRSRSTGLVAASRRPVHLSLFTVWQKGRHSLKWSLFLSATY